MTTTDTIARLRACPAVRELAEEMARDLHNAAADYMGMQAILVWEYGPPDVKRAWVAGVLRSLTTPTSPLWPYYRAVLRALAERRDGRWGVEYVEKHPEIGPHWYATGPDPQIQWVGPDGTEEDAIIERDEWKRDHWSRLEHGPDEAFLAELLAVLEVTS